MNIISSRERPIAAPFLKWAGGKGKLLHEIVARMPSSITGAYIEPFLGGGAVFFRLFSLGRFASAEKVLLSDCNKELINSYTAVRDRVDSVIRVLQQHRNEADYFYQLREQDPKRLRLHTRAARTIYLNRVGFNGLYRVNRKGKFNVPFGAQQSANICQERVLRAASNALQEAGLRACDFRHALKQVRSGDVVYFDPPYVPLSFTSSFTSYNAQGFGLEDQHALAAEFTRLAQLGAHVLLSNSDTPLTRSLYQHHKIHVIAVRRQIGAQSASRAFVNEILVEGLAS